MASRRATPTVTSTTPRPGSQPSRTDSALNRRTSVGAFSAKNKLRKPHPGMPVTHGPDGKSTPVSSDLSDKSASPTPQAPQASSLSPVPEVMSSHSSSTLATDRHPSPPIRTGSGQAALGNSIARPNSSLSLLKPSATKAENVKTLRTANRAIKLKLIRALSKMFSFSGKRKDNVDIPRKRPKWIRIFIPKKHLAVREEEVGKKGKGRAKNGIAAPEQGAMSIVVAETSKSQEILNSERQRTEDQITVTSVTKAKANKHKREKSVGKTEVNGISNGDLKPQRRPTSKPPKGALRLHSKKGDVTTAMPDGTTAHSDAQPLAKSPLPAGAVLVEDPVWRARKEAHQERPQTPPHTHIRPFAKTDSSRDSPRSRGKSRGVASSKSLITAYESGVVMEDISRESARSKQRGSWFRDKDKKDELNAAVEAQNGFTGKDRTRRIEQNAITEVQGVTTIVPPAPAPTPPHDMIGLAITTDDAGNPGPLGATPKLLPPFSRPVDSGFDSDSDDDNLRQSWRLPSDLSLPTSAHDSSPKSARTVTPTQAYESPGPTRNHRTSISSTSSNLSTPTPTPTTTRHVISPSRLRRSPHFDLTNGQARDEDDLVEFNVLVRPGDSLYDLLIKKEQSQQNSLDEVDLDAARFNENEESEIEYFTADEMDSSNPSEKSSILGDETDDEEENDEDDVSSESSETGTIRAVEIASEGGTMRGVEIVGKQQRMNGRAMNGRGMDGRGIYQQRRRARRNSGEENGAWGYADILVGARR